MLVSVVVPVYNAGRFFERCVASLLQQSMPAGTFEILLIDDGSSDETPKFMDTLAQQHESVRVFHELNSGWAGRPRNVGVRQALGEYVQFVDHDDELNREALQRVYDLGKRNSADIVLGKVGGTMAAPSNVFAQTVSRCTVDDANLFESLTPHKMFRRQFLLEQCITFPEGRVRLEDQNFMVKAYLRANIVSIVGNYVCYLWQRRDDGGNTSMRAVAPSDYFRYVAELMDSVIEETDPGERRNNCLRRFLRVEISSRLREPNILRYSEAHRSQSFEAIQQVVLDRMPFLRGAIDGMSAPARLRFRLLEKNRLDSLVKFAQRQSAEVLPRTSVVRVSHRRGNLRLKLTAELSHPDGRPVVLVGRPKGGYLMDQYFTEGIPGVPKHGWVVGDPRHQAQLEVRVLDVEAQTAWFPPTSMKALLQHIEGNHFKVVIKGRSVINPRTLGLGLSSGRYDVKVGYQILGYQLSHHPIGPAGPLLLRVNERGRAHPVRAVNRSQRMVAKLLALPLARRFGHVILRALPTRTGNLVRRRLKP